MDIRELTAREEVKEAFPLIKQLRTGLDENTYLAYFEEMQKTGYRLFALVDSGQYAALIGFTKRVEFFYGHHIWIHDLVVDENVRSKGYGAKLISYVHDLAKAEGISKVALASGLTRTKAHHFYESKMGYEKVSYDFLKNIDTQ